MTVLAAGFERVAEAFEGTLDGGGAAFAAVVDGELVVDLWGGDVERDSLQLIFSGTKGLVAVCLLLLLERGQLERLDREVRESQRRRRLVAQALATGRISKWDHPEGSRRYIDTGDDFWSTLERSRRA